MTEKPDTRASRLQLHPHALSGYEFIDLNSNQIAKPLGSGGSGIVFKANQTIADTVTLPRAIKFFLYRDDIASLTRHKKSPISADDFKSEIYNITSFNHQNLVKVIDAGIRKCTEGDVPYIVTDFISGPTLKQVIEKNGHPKCIEIRSRITEKPEIIINLLIDVGSAVKHIFDRGFSHCDIAPKNIFLEESSSEIQPILGDLGISKSLDIKQNIRKSVFIAGSKDWVPDHVLKVLEEEINYSDFVDLQPDWDIYSFCKTGLTLVDSFEISEGQVWYAAVRKALNKGLTRGGYRNINDVIKRLEFLKPIQREVAQIPELSNGIGSGVRKMMPVEALKATKRLNALVQHPAIFRLSKVPQLTTANHILPGSGHTRYEHTLGTLETMRRYLLSLLDESEFLEYFSVEKIESALIAAAFSSATRFPLSNVIHEMRGRDKNHFKALSRRSLFEEILKIEDEKGRTAAETIGKGFKNIGDVNYISVMLKGSSNLEEDDELISSMLNSSLDIRVVDFVRRDAHHLGIISGDTFNLDEILAHLTVHEHRLALKETGVSVAEHIVSLRYWLFSRAYWNRPNRAFFAMARYVLSHLYDHYGERALSPAVLTKDQSGFLKMLKEKSKEAGLADCIAIMEKLDSDRYNIYKLVYESNISQVNKEVAQWAIYTSFSQFDEFTRSIEDDFRSYCKRWCREGERALLFDFPTEPGANKLGDDIYVISKRSPPALLTDVSDIVRGVNESFRKQLSKIRIYSHPDIKVFDDKKDAVEEFINQALIDFVETHPLQNNNNI